MRRFVLLLLLAAAGVYLTFGGGWRAFKEYRVRSALVEAGLSDKRADCMARRMVKRLSIVQLYKLQRFEGESHSLGAYIAGVRRVGDGEAIAVTASSAALCATGIAR
ncbi:hypothetical protein [Novosphingobium album (ex Liu et al. 2023)]